MKLPFAKMVLRNGDSTISLFFFAKSISRRVSEGLPVSDKAKFCKFSDLRLKNVLLLKQSPKCVTHETFINKSKPMPILYDYHSFWDTVLFTNTTKSQYWQKDCEEYADTKRSWRENFVSKSGNYVDSKFQVMTQSMCIGELLQSLVN